MENKESASKVQLPGNHAKKHEIRICLGSSCFSRGNEENLEFIKQYIKENQLRDLVDFRGQLCIGNCKNGPNLQIDDVIYNNITENTLPSILEKHLKNAVK
jgi:NADH:ubiquinone oxidoreductase subunit E